MVVLAIAQLPAPRVAAPEDPKGMVVIDACSVHSKPSFTRWFQSAKNNADPAVGDLPRIEIEFVPTRCTGWY